MKDLVPYSWLQKHADKKNNLWSAFWRSGVVILSREN